MYKLLIFTSLLGIGFCSGVLYSKQNIKSNLDKYYFDTLTVVKSRLLFGSEVDTKKSLEDYEDKIELFMHLDGYDSLEILDMKSQATLEAVKLNKPGVPSSNL